MLSVRFLTSILILITGDFQSNTGFYGVNANDFELGNGAQYLGCFKDNPTRDLEQRFADHLTIEECFDQVKGAGLIYAGLQYGKECFGGNSHGIYGRVLDTECTYTCNSNSDPKICGGYWVQSIFTVESYDTTSPTKSPVPLPSESPTIIGAFGDPHIKTWTGQSYDFHGVCDLVLFSNPSFDNGSGLDIYIRNKRMEMWSFIETAVIRIGKDKFELAGGKDNDTFLINGIIHKVSNENGAVGNISGYDIKFIQVNDKTRKFVINLDTNHNNEKLEEIVFTTWNSFVSVTVKNPTNDHFDGSLGLMGSYPVGAMVARDGNTVFDDSNEFGQEWQVLSSEPQLFAERGTVGPNDMCSSPSNAEMRRRLQGSVVTLKEAEIACGSVHRETKDLCIFDVLATHDKSSSGAY